MNHTDETIKTALNILIVDDHKLVRDGIRMMFVSLKKTLTTNITESESGEDAITKCKGLQAKKQLFGY